ncbi:MAG: class I poly(R)-hydroxyalkanoic acid synthase [Rhodobacteraceae bacterium]|jgi:polyhydroxyalkanoate synthase|nr:class I poly(R)-hydroxyalkanoic acid synthase [Paracoccaceae bacterium]MBL4558688.1 class I poly(R)-hydroxyalkanoic acid synthase [Paracoccaceae bacterium]HBG98106.1 class I poly(R)-hydroxyalkanoic acid synthase [Paracoccaceae bacterium]
MAESGDEPETGATNLDRLNRNIKKIEALNTRLIAALQRREVHEPGLHAPNPSLYSRAYAAMVAEMLTNPAKMLEHQVSYWGKSLKHWVEAQQALSSGELRAPEDRTPADKRFSSPLWQSHPYFNFIKQQYLLSAEAIEGAVNDLDGLGPDEKRRMAFFTRQLVDLMSPANYLGTNPEALARAVETEGQSLVDGLENLVRDIEANDGELLVTLADRDAFEVGRNIATSEGAVVYRNRMFELIQYAPRTETVHRTPLLIFPPWINKFYILDLRETNSMIRWITEQGFTLFVVSWVNPDGRFADIGIDEYVAEGYLEAIAQVRAITGEAKVNVVGYCIGGTALAIALGYMARTGDKSVRSATYFTTLTDFADPGEVGVFLSNDFVDGIEREVADKGYLHSHFMARTFSYLRAPDLVYGPAVRSYMMGQAPPAFDLLYWNGDSTNLPGKMVVQYLRRLCQDNEFAEAGYAVLGQRVRLKDIQIPLVSIACETDHIAPWRSAFVGFAQMGSRDKTFILSESGHIAGIVNPPSKGKYGHYTSDGPLDDPDSWQAGASFTKGSWWPRWRDWLARRSGAQVPARAPGGPHHPVLDPAPGTYVKAGSHGR